MESSSSPRWSINWTDLYKSVRGAVVVFVAAFPTVFVAHVEQIIETGGMPMTIDAAWSAFKIAIVSTLVELGRRYLTNQAK